MGRKVSSLALLPEDIRQQFLALLRDPRMSQLEVTARINDLLAETGSEDRVSKSAVNRFALKFEKTIKRRDEAAAVAEMWTQRWGNLPAGELGQVMIQMLQTLAFDISGRLQEAELDDETMPGTIKALKDLSIMIERTERAAALNSDRIAEIKKQALTEAAEAVTSVSKRGGLSDEAAEAIRSQILGIRP
jgi:hypothetical protein